MRREILKVAVVAVAVIALGAAHRVPAERLRAGPRLQQERLAALHLCHADEQVSGLVGAYQGRQGRQPPADGERGDRVRPGGLLGGGQGAGGGRRL